MAKLNQIIAVTKGVKAQTTREFTEAHRNVQKAPLLSGISRSYQPKDEEGEQLPPESTRVQVSATDVIAEVSTSLTRLFDLVLTQDVANTRAKADVVVDGRTILADVPVTYLLFLEKQLVELYSFVDKLPVLDPAESWTFNDAAGAYASDPVKTVRSRKVMRNHVKAEATEKHPAQVEVYTEDVPVGYWTTVKLSGALPATRVKELRERVAKLQQAVKFAREQANMTEVEDMKAGEWVFGYLFG
ncbi:hypothetical protein [Micromonospora inyonensis]|uniref:Uncharacterized protein n=1 Tax=Micromonospora inyonensis TaxID=47866 RepID=A0A1C6RZK4_9ACTN|nr:hypothetical protein [Micromonospora inyonensis]SCL22468.1 hypothetical protein GA0074694_3369 [Micromonospora inyonensis]